MRDAIQGHVKLERAFSLLAPVAPGIVFVIRIVTGSFDAVHVFVHCVCVVLAISGDGLVSMPTIAQIGGLARVEISHSLAEVRIEKSPAIAHGTHNRFKSFSGQGEVFFFEFAEHFRAAWAQALLVMVAGVSGSSK
jgi:hypothetical protein